MFIARYFSANKPAETLPIAKPMIEQTGSVIKVSIEIIKAGMQVVKMSQQANFVKVFLI